MRPTKQEYQKARYRAIQIKQLLFFGFLVLMGFIGLLWFARPKTSVVEKRDLSEFPKLSLSGLLDGSFCAGVEKWYADTYPLREGLVDANTMVKSLYGLQGEQIINNGEKADEIPSGSVDLEELAGRSTTEATTPPATDKPVNPGESGVVPPASTETPTPATTEYNGQGAGDVTDGLVQSGSIYIANGAGYGVYYFSESNSARYCLLVNKLAKNLAGKAQVSPCSAPSPPASCSPTRSGRRPAPPTSTRPRSGSTGTWIPR